MSMIDLVPQIIADVAAFLLGKVLGRKFELDRGRAQRIGMYLIYGAFALAGIIVTLLYS